MIVLRLTWLRSNSIVQKRGKLWKNWPKWVGVGRAPWPTLGNVYMALGDPLPPWGLGCLRRELVLRTPMRIVKATEMVRFLGITVKRLGPVSMLGQARYNNIWNVYGVGSPTVGPTSSVRLPPPPPFLERRGFKMRICPPYPQRVVKGDLMGRFIGIG